MVLLFVSQHTDKKKKLKPEKAERRETELLYPNLILLDLSSNEIEWLPPDICDLTHLAELKISCNRIKEVSFLWIVSHVQAI